MIIKMKLTASQLKMIGKNIFIALGATPKNAEIVSDMLVEANLTGHDSHGIVYITRYAERIKKGIIDPKAEPEVIKETTSTGVVDGHWTFGQVTAKKTMEVAIEKAKRSSISAVAAIRCNHIGRLGGYTMMAAEENMIGMMFVNVVHPNVQPYGGATGVFGTNPLSVAIPAGEMKPFLLDFATSAVAEGKVTLAAIKGEKIPFGWIVDKNGNDTDNPKDLYPEGATRPEDRGRLLTIGAREKGQGHKGYCLSFLMEILGGVLTGSGSVIGGEITYPSQNGVLAIVIDIESFIPVELFKKRIDILFKGVQKTSVLHGYEYDHVLIPGEPEWMTKEKRLRDGIEVPQEIWKGIKRLSEDLGINLEENKLL
jgi:LDH2 family malate/lactate/ureidoglycolate dehydrogenase